MTTSSAGMRLRPPNVFGLFSYQLAWEFYESPNTTSNEWKTKEASRTGGHREIHALTLLITFVASFSGLLVINLCLIGRGSDYDEPKKAWFELMKSASILLGTALTTVIGYYFGQRESAQIRREAQAAETKAQTKENEAEAVKQTFKNLTEALPSDMPNNFNVARDDLRGP